MYIFEKIQFEFINDELINVYVKNEEILKEKRDYMRRMGYGIKSGYLWNNSGITY